MLARAGHVVGRVLEIITRIDNMPAPDVKAFEKLINRPDELRFTVKRMSRSRIVRIRHSGIQPIESGSTPLIESE